MTYATLHPDHQNDYIIKHSKEIIKDTKTIINVGNEGCFKLFTEVHELDYHSVRLDPIQTFDEYLQDHMKLLRKIRRRIKRDTHYR